MDSHWRDQLRPRLDGLTDDEYFWEPIPGCWSLRQSESGESLLASGQRELAMDYAEPPHDREPVTTIAWRLAHLRNVLGSPRAPHFTVQASDPPRIHYSGSAQAALRQFDEAYEARIADVRGLGDAGLARPQGALSPPQFADVPMVRRVMYGHVEVIHHGAEICLLRDLYAWRTDDREA